MSRLSIGTSATPLQRVKRERRRSLMGRRYTDRTAQYERWDGAPVSAGPFTIDSREKKLYVEGEEKSLSPQLFDFLTIFIANPNRVLSPADLAANLWPTNDRLDSKEIKQYVYRLRRLIEPDPAKPQWIVNVRGFGYELKIN